jgi:hypothetical protein
MNSSHTAAADRLWQRFGEMFGARFFESFGPKPSESWTEAVKDLRHDQVKGALSRIRNSGSAHPPSLPEFISLAKNIQPYPERPAAPAPVHPLQGAANGALLSLLNQRGPASAECIRELIAAKNKIASTLPPDSDPAEVRDVLLGVFEQLWAPMPAAECAAILERHTRGAA